MRTIKRLALSIALLAVVSAWAAPAGAQLSDPTIGEAAPAFTLSDTHGNEQALESYRGKWVVLEWLNYGCPYVGKHYNSGNMSALQAKYRDQDVVWFSIVSSARGQQGYYEPDEMIAMNEEKGNKATAVLLDPEGEVGRAYGARTTPQMVVIDPDGALRYNGAIDDKPTTRLSDVEDAHNYLAAALDEAMAGKEVSQPRTQPYGCGVKYKR